jgi:aarF domain-containing kinase
MSIGAAGELIRRTVNPSDNHGSAIMSEANVTRLVDNLSQMRGAALKLGQLMSIQGASLFYLNSSY